MDKRREDLTNSKSSIRSISITERLEILAALKEILASRKLSLHNLANVTRRQEKEREKKKSELKARREISVITSGISRGYRGLFSLPRPLASSDRARAPKLLKSRNPQQLGDFRTWNFVNCITAVRARVNSRKF